MKGRPRPISLKTDVIKQRNRLKACDRRHKSQPHTDGEPPRLRSSSPPHRRQSTRSRDPARGSANARKSDPGGVLDTGPRTPTEHHPSVRSKRRKDLSQTPPADPSLHQGLQARLACVLPPEDSPPGSLRTQSLAGFRSTSTQPQHPPCPPPTRLGLSLGSPRDFSFDLRPVSLDQLSQHALPSDTTDAPSRIAHGLIPARRIPPPEILSFPPIPSPLARSLSVDRSPVTRSPVDFHRVQPTANPIIPRDDDQGRGRPRFRESLRLPPFSQLTAQVPFPPHEPLSCGLSTDTRFSSATSTPYEHSPSRTTCGPPLSFEASALEARNHSPQASRLTNLPPIHSASPLSHHYPQHSNRACSVASSASDNDSIHSAHHPSMSWPDPEPGRLLSSHQDPAFHPSIPPELRRGRSETRKEYESEEELGRLRNRVAELELLNGLMKTRIGQLERAESEENNHQHHSRTCSAASVTRWTASTGEEFMSIGSSSSGGGVGHRMTEDLELDRLQVMEE